MVNRADELCGQALDLNAPCSGMQYCRGRRAARQGVAKVLDRVGPFIGAEQYRGLAIDELESFRTRFILGSARRGIP